MIGSNKMTIPTVGIHYSKSTGTIHLLLEDNSPAVGRPERACDTTGKVGDNSFLALRVKFHQIRTLAGALAGTAKNNFACR